MSDELNILSLMDTEIGVFRPIAYFDKHLDCIRVKFMDCRVVEVRLNCFLTMLTRPNSDGHTSNVGFTIKGIAHLFEQIGLQREGIYSLVYILNKILAKYPDQAVKRVYEEFSSVSNIDVEIRRAAA